MKDKINLQQQKVQKVQLIIKAITLYVFIIFLCAVLLCWFYPLSDLFTPLLGKLTLATFKYCIITIITVIITCASNHHVAAVTA